jgi:exosortase/archaeosortase
MKISKPCKKCIVRACCEEQSTCEIKSKYENKNVILWSFSGIFIVFITLFILHQNIFIITAITFLSMPVCYFIAFCVIVKESRKQRKRFYG